MLRRSEDELQKEKAELKSLATRRPVEAVAARAACGKGTAVR